MLFGKEWEIKTLNGHKKRSWWNSHIKKPLQSVENLFESNKSIKKLTTICKSAETTRPIWQIAKMPKNKFANFLGPSGPMVRL